MCIRCHRFRALPNQLSRWRPQPWLGQAGKCKPCRPKGRKSRSCEESGLGTTGIALIGVPCALPNLAFRKDHRRLGYSSDPMSRSHPGFYRKPHCIHGLQKWSVFPACSEKAVARLGSSGIPQTSSSCAAVAGLAILKSLLFLLSTLHECGQSKAERALQSMSLPGILPDTEDDLL